EAADSLKVLDPKRPIREADIGARLDHVRFTPESGHSLPQSECLLWAKSRLMHCSKQPYYSITSSARARSEAGTSMPSALAVLRLITSRKLVGCWTGRSPTLAPLRIR